MREVATLVAIGFLTLADTASQARPPAHTLKECQCPVTGANRLISQPVFDFGGPFPLAAFIASVIPAH